MTDAPMPVRPGFHLVEPSPWPIIGAAFALLTAIGLVMFMHGVGVGPLVLALGGAGVLFTMAGWWRDVIIEAQDGYHNAIVRHGLTIGMILFIASEVMFFVAWFWAFFASCSVPERSAGLRPSRLHRRHLAAEGHGGARPSEAAADEHLRAGDVELCGQRRPRRPARGQPTGIQELSPGGNRRSASCSSSRKPTSTSTRPSPSKTRSTARPSSWRPASMARMSSSA